MEKGVAPEVTDHPPDWFVSFPNMLVENSALIWSGPEERPDPAVVRTWCVEDVKWMLCE